MRRSFLLCGSVCLALCSAHATSVVYTWSGAGDGTSMNSSGNWGVTGVPVSGTSTVLTFPVSPTTFTPNNNIAPNFEFQSMSFAHAYTLTGDSFMIAPSFGAGITFSTTASTISAQMNLAASSSALNINSTGTNIMNGGFIGNGVINLLQGQLNVGGSGAFTGTVNITGQAAASVLQTTTTNCLGTPLSVNLTEPGGTAYTATFNLNGFGQIIYGLSGSTGTTVSLGSATLTLSTAGSYQTPFYGTLSGTGALVLEDNANLALMGTNSYTGSTTLQQGASLFTKSVGGTSGYIIGGGGGSLQFDLGSSATVSKPITLGDTTTISTNGHTVTYTGAMTGSGTLTKLGRGELILSGGSNSITGPLLLEGGILTITSSTPPTGPITFQSYGGTLRAGTSGVLIPQSQSITINIPATFDTNGYNMTINGPISGGSKFVKAGAGVLTLALSGNTFTGKTVILGGTLNATPITFPANTGGTEQLVFQGTGTSVFQAAAAFPNFVPPVVFQSPGTIDTQTFGVTLNGVVAGKGAITKEGAGTLTLANTGNLFTGNVIINNGTLTASPQTYPSALSSSASLTFADTGNGIFQASGNFTSATSTAFAAPINLTANGTIDAQTFGVEVDVTGGVTGEPTYTLSTLGNVNIKSQSYFTGLITVQSGILAVNHIAANDTQVNSGATLKGTGTHSGDVVILSGGTIAPGNSVGTMTVGTLTLNSGSTTSIEIDGTAASQIIVTGAASLAGALQVVADPGPYAHAGSYLIIDAGSMSDTFSSIIQSPGFTFSLNYLTDQVYLNYLLAIETAGLSGNNLTVADYLNANAPASSEYTALAGLSGDALRDAVNSISPARNAFGPFAAAQTLFVIDDMVYNHLADRRFFALYDQKNGAKPTYADASDMPMPPAPPGQSFEFWVGGFGQFTRQAKESQNPVFNFISEGGMLAFDYKGLQNQIFGLGLGYAHTHLRDENHMGSAKIDYYFASLFASCGFCNFYLEPAVFGVFNPIQNKRVIAYSDYDYAAKAYIKDWQLDSHLGFGYNAIFSWGGLEPFIAVDWAVNWESSFNEHGASALNMIQKSHTSSMLQSEAGLKFYQVAGPVGFKEALSYINRVPFKTGKVTAAITGSSTFFNLTSLTEIQNLGAANLEIFAKLGKHHQGLISLTYQSEFGVNYISNEIFLRLARSF